MHKPYFQDIKIVAERAFSLRCFERHTKDIWTVNYHFHELYELVVYEKIAGTFYCDGQASEILNGQAVLIPPDSIHGFEVQPGTLIYHVLHFYPQYLISVLNIDRLPTRASLQQLNPCDFELILALIKWLSINGQNAKAPSEIHHVFAVLAKILWSRGFEESDSPQGTSNAFEPLVRYLNSSKKFSVDLDTAAELCHLSRSHFMAKFKKTYGTTFNDFLMERKISTAKYLLSKSDKNIGEIAEHLEMGSPAYFSSRFKDIVGLSPRDYRRKLTP